MTTSDLTDGQWERLHSRLPWQKPCTGCPTHDYRAVLNGTLWILRTCRPRRSPPERNGWWKLISSRFNRWQQAGSWERVLAPLQQQTGVEERGRRYLKERRIGAVIPTKADEDLVLPFDRDAHRERSVVERLFSRLEQHGRIATASRSGRPTTWRS